MKHDDVSGRSEVELTRLAGELQGQIFKLRLERGMGQLKKTADLRKARRHLARVLTFLSKKEVRTS